ncbi:MAG: hypothetical protein GY862_24980 [Gammaproteobacteria bacterium]|nr:hypothetical protein [Gammaproteobacteria bacterium]
MKRIILGFLGILQAMFCLAAEPPPAEGEVRVPLGIYTDLIQQAKKDKRPAPARYAIGKAVVTVQVREEERRAAGAVQIAFSVEVFENEWTLVPVLSAAAALTRATVNGNPAQLTQGADGLAWATQKAGTYAMQIHYSVDAISSETGLVLPVSLPRAAAVQLQAVLPGIGLNAAIIPAVAMKTLEQDKQTRISADVPANNAVQISWRPPNREGYAMSRAHYRGELRGDALVWTARLNVEIFSGERVALPLLPRGVTLSDVLVDDVQAVVLVENDKFTTLVQGPGKHELTLHFQTPVARKKGPPEVRLQIPEIPVSQFELVLPGKKEVSVTPSASVTSVHSGEAPNEQTIASVYTPMTDKAVFSWTEAVPRELRDELRVHANLYHAVYAEEGVLHGQAVAVYQITRGETNVLELDIPAGVQIDRIHAPAGGVSDWRVNKQAEDEGQSDPLPKVEGGRLPAKLKIFLDRKITGDFRFTVYYERLLNAADKRVAVPLLRASRVRRQRGMAALLSGPELALKPVRIERISKVSEKQLPVFVRKALSMSVAHTYKYMDENPLLTVQVLKDLRDELRANASLYHAVHAEEGVLHGRAIVTYEITHGETKLLEFEVPEDVQINRIQAADSSILDHRVRKQTMDTGEEKQLLTVFLKRKTKGNFAFSIYYERLLDAGGERIPIPLLRAVEVHRQRGMVALLSGQELALNPLEAKRMSKVGENQLPAFVRSALHMTVAHTYKYIDENPYLAARAMAPERKRGKFDAQVDTLVSIGDVTLKGAATIEVNVKSGSVMALDLRLPTDVNVLELTAPSLRTYVLSSTDEKELSEDNKKSETDDKKIKVEFTQEMEGQFRVELSYEHILSEGGGEARVPTVSVEDAEVEHGRIAVEALAAVEVQASRAEQLSSVDINELPQQLVLKTTNPILLAYRYVHVDPPYQLALKVTRHQEIDVQAAAIEQARYETLLTRDGLAVTTAHYTIRNTRKQFLRLQLPPGSEIWSVFVGGKSEKPARVEAAGKETEAGQAGVLIKMINSTSGFPMEMVYATQMEKLGMTGDISAQLPRPDMVATHSRWEVYLPHRFKYQIDDTNMDALIKGIYASPSQMKQAGQSMAMQQQALQIRVPARGIRFAFEKLYANKSEEETWFSIAYVSADALLIGRWLSAAGALLAGLGLLALAYKSVNIPHQAGIGGIVVGIGLLTYAWTGLAADILPAALIWAAIVLIVVLLWARQRWLARL